jgi:hypothetical protein
MAVGITPPAQTPGLKRYRARIYSNVVKASIGRDLVHKGFLSQGKDVFEKGLSTDMTELYGLPLMDLELTHDDAIDAYKIAAAFMKFPGSSIELQLRASLAAALVGEVYQGQREFVEQHIKISMCKDSIDACPQGDSPNAVAILSALAIANDDYCQANRVDAIPYASLVLRLDPGNPGACDLLGEAIAQTTYNYTQAIGVFMKGISRAKGVTKLQLLSSIKSNNEIKQMFGDGHPFVPPVIRRPDIIRP